MAGGLWELLALFSLRDKNSGCVFRLYQFDLGFVFSRMWTCVKTGTVRALSALIDLTVPAQSCPWGSPDPCPGPCFSQSQDHWSLPQECWLPAPHSLALALHPTELADLPANVLVWPQISLITMNLPDNPGWAQLPTLPKPALLTSLRDGRTSSWPARPANWIIILFLVP